jgi:hypothetical protein
MACFLMAMGLGSITTAFRNRFPGNLHVNWLNMLLWGGAAGLILEHIAHGEIVASFPFFTAVKDGNTMAMLAEIATTGTAMVAACVGVWLGMLWVSSKTETRAKASA